MSEVLVEVTRGPLVELIYRGDIAVVDAAGRLLYAAGDPLARRTWWRSAAKPFQAMPLVYTGAADRYGLEPADLALVCASHNGESEHTRRAEAILARIGLGPEALRCGAHEPFDRETARDLVRSGAGATPLHNNCSGKHAGMLALARHLGCDPAGYLDPGHPVQQVILENVAVVTGLPGSRIALAVDGCGVPTFGLSLYHMALAFARLAEPEAIPPEPGAEVTLPPGYRPPEPEERRAAAARVRAAMTAHPYLVAGRRRFDTALMEAAGGRIVSKIGAAGVWCAGIVPEAAREVPALREARGGVGIALKIEDQTLDGGPRETAATAVLAELGILGEGELQQLHYYHRWPVRNVAGIPVGEQRAVFRLRKVT